MPSTILWRCENPLMIVTGPTSFWRSAPWEELALWGLKLIRESASDGKSRLLGSTDEITGIPTSGTSEVELLHSSAWIIGERYAVGIRCARGSSGRWARMLRMTMLWCATRSWHREKAQKCVIAESPIYRRMTWWYRASYLFPHEAYSGGGMYRSPYPDLHRSRLHRLWLLRSITMGFHQSIQRHNTR